MHAAEGVTVVLDRDALQVVGLVDAEDLLIEIVDFQSLLALVWRQDKALQIIAFLL